MHLETENGPVLAVCAHPAWQKTVHFDCLRRNEVNRARRVRESGGGKGVNVARVLRMLGYPVTIGTFLGGHNGRLLEAELQGLGAVVLAGRLEAELRICTTVVCQDDHTATELIEPSPEVPADVSCALRDRLAEACPRHGAVCLAGSRMPGVGIDFYVAIAESARRHHVPLLLDDVKEVEAVLATGGVTMLKINAAELRRITGDSGTPLPVMARDFLAVQPVSWLALTDGAARAWLFSRGGRAWVYEIPPVGGLVSAIGCGDCVAAIMTRRLSERPDEEGMAAGFAEALGCASASCKTESPSIFDPADVVLPRYGEHSL